MCYIKAWTDVCRYANPTVCQMMHESLASACKKRMIIKLKPSSDTVKENRPEASIGHSLIKVLPKATWFVLAANSPKVRVKQRQSPLECRRIHLLELVELIEIESERTKKKKLPGSAVKYQCRCGLTGLNEVNHRCHPFLFFNTLDCFGQVNIGAQSA